MPLELRTGAAADVDGLLELWAEAAENTDWAPDTREAVTALFGRDPDAVIVAEHDAELVGSVIAGWDGWRCHLYRLAVRPAWRRRGVGSALLRAAEARFRAVGAARADADGAAQQRPRPEPVAGRGLSQSRGMAPLGQDAWVAAPAVMTRGSYRGSRTSGRPEDQVSAVHPPASAAIPATGPRPPAPRGTSRPPDAHGRGSA